MEIQPDSIRNLVLITVESGTKLKSRILYKFKRKQDQNSLKIMSGLDRFFGWFAGNNPTRKIQRPWCFFFFFPFYTVLQ